jgi:hypothetical protein
VLCRDAGTSRLLVRTFSRRAHALPPPTRGTSLCRIGITGRKLSSVRPLRMGAGC